MSLEIPKNHMNRFMGVLEWLEASPPSKRADREESAKQFKVDFLHDSPETISVKVAHLRINGPNALHFLSRPDAKEFIRSIQNDLLMQTNIVSELLRDYRRCDDFPAPGYAKRIGIILRKAKRKDLSDRFDVAYNRYVNADEYSKGRKG